MTDSQAQCFKSESEMLFGAYLLIFAAFTTNLVLQFVVRLAEASIEAREDRIKGRHVHDELTNGCGRRLMMRGHLLLIGLFAVRVDRRPGRQSFNGIKALRSRSRRSTRVNKHMAGNVTEGLLRVLSNASFEPVSLPEDASPSRKRVVSGWALGRSSPERNSRTAKETVSRVRGASVDAVTPEGLLTPDARRAQRKRKQFRRDSESKLDVEEEKEEEKKGVKMTRNQIDRRDSLRLAEPNLNPDNPIGEGRILPPMWIAVVTKSTGELAFFWNQCTGECSAVFPSEEWDVDAVEAISRDRRIDQARAEERLEEIAANERERRKSFDAISNGIARSTRGLFGAAVSTPLPTETELPLQQSLLSNEMPSQARESDP
jgi:hypothetical protein